LKWDAVGSILKQTKRKHASNKSIKNLQPTKIYKSPVVA
jgi:hypothetical protein